MTGRRSEKTPSAIVSDFYTAVNARDGEAITTLLDRHVADDAVLEWPASLPYGGRVAGAARIGRALGAMATATEPIGPDAVEVLGLTASGDVVAAELAFDWYPPDGSPARRSAAVELWRFEEGRISGMKAFYWDTAALLSDPT